MASNFHLKIKDVAGEATQKGHEGEIEILAWSWGASNPVNTKGGGMGLGKAEFGELSFTHLYDKSSPIIAKSLAGGKHFPDAKMTARKAGDGQKDFLTITLKQVYITSVHPSGSGGGDLVETVSLAYKDIEFEYKAQDDKGGTGGSIKFGVDVATMEVR
jgi:type VI secretion system secreted protein Hcp